MAPKTKQSVTVEVCSCAGTKKDQLEILFRPAPGSPGFVTIGEKKYRLECIGDGLDDVIFEQADGTRYTVTHWTDRPGNFSCECPDWKYRSHRGQRFCRHLNALRALKGLE